MTMRSILRFITDQDYPSLLALAAVLSVGLLWLELAR
jgi:hypothetical protein